MSSFKKLNTKIYQKSDSVITPDNIYWKKQGAPVLVKEFGPIDYIDFSPIDPYYFAVTCSVRVQVYNPITKLPAKNLSRFRENAYGATFRSDGRLLCAGSEEKAVKLFDVSTKSLLRLFKGHTAPVHRTHFVNNRPQIASFSDDKSVKIWDIPTETATNSYADHTDYVRAGACSPIASDIILSGAYDNTVKMYDTRTDQVVLSVDHGSPIESLLFLPSGGIFLSAGGTDIKIWDVLAGGKLLQSVSQHHKTVTCLRLASDNTRLLSASLDRHVKVYDINTYKVVHTMDFANSILSLGISKNDDTLVAGLVDGIVAISRRETEDKEVKKETKKASFRYSAGNFQPSVDLVVPETKHDKETKHDRCLRKFEYSKGLDCAMLSYVANKTPQVTVSVLQELVRRRALHKAFTGRDAKSIGQILRFFIRHITNFRFTRVLVDAANVFLDVYEDRVPTMPTDVRNQVLHLCQLLEDELKLIDQLHQQQGAMMMLMSVASQVQTSPSQASELQNLTPSADAQKNLVVNLT